MLSARQHYRKSKSSARRTVQKSGAARDVPDTSRRRSIDVQIRRVSFPAIRAPNTEQYDALVYTRAHIHGEFARVRVYGGAHRAGGGARRGRRGGRVCAVFRIRVGWRARVCVWRRPIRIDTADGRREAHARPPHPSVCVPAHCLHLADQIISASRLPCDARFVIERRFDSFFFSREIFGS